MKKTCEKLAEAVGAYLFEYDNPVPDYGLRKILRDRLRSLLATLKSEERP